MQKEKRIKKIENQIDELRAERYDLIEVQNQLVGGCIQNGTPRAYLNEKLEVGYQFKIVDAEIKELDTKIEKLDREWCKLNNIEYE